MATYAEIASLKQDGALGERICAGLLVKARAVLNEVLPGNQARHTWAQGVFLDPIAEIPRARNYLLADNASATVLQIQASTDNQIATALNGYVDKFIAQAV
jgi:hypothetical protein